MISLSEFLSYLPNLNYVALDSDLKIRSIGGEYLSQFEITSDRYVNHSLDEISFLTRKKIFHKIQKAYRGEVYEREFRLRDKSFHAKFFPYDLETSSERLVVFIFYDTTFYRRKETLFKKIFETEENVIRYEEKLFREIREIFDWREEIKSKGKQSLWMDRALPNLNTSLMQGSGLGALISTINSLIKRAEVKEEKAVISLTHLNLLKESYDSTKKLVSTLAKAQKILEDSIDSLETITLLDFYELVNEETVELEGMLRIKNQKILLSSIPTNRTMFFRIQRDAMKTVLREIFINAMKYTPKDHDIIVLFIQVQDKLAIKFINPSSYAEVENLNFLHSEEEILFQPFFRLIRAVEEGYDKEEFGLGLGLPIVKKLIEEMGGDVYMNLVRTNITDTNRSEVCFTIEVPLLSEAI